jgi:F-box and leucine-rich repeat protein GRR1
VEVDFMNCDINNTALQSLFQNSKELRELRISQVDNTSRLKISDKGFTIPMHYEQLRLVDFTGIQTITDMSIDVLVQASPKIRSLVLNKCNRITDDGILSVCKLGRYLHFLHLGHCILLTDRSITQLASSCNRIRYLDMACCLNISDKSIIELAKNLSKLKRIGLVKCVYITDFAIHALACQSRITSNLERIHLSYCTRLSVESVSRLLNVCPRLNHLSLTNVPAFQRHDLQEFRRTPPKDFTEAQIIAFCVYSGKGVQDLKKYLNTVFPFETA